MASGRGAVRMLSASRLVSVAGSDAARIALAFAIYEKTHSAIWLSATLLLTFGITGLLNPIAGAISDRFDRRLVMVSSELMGAGAFTLLAFAHSPSTLLALGFLAAVVATPFPSASGAAIPNLVGPEHLTWANSLVSTSYGLARTIGPAIGGVLVGSFGTSLVRGERPRSLRRAGS